LTLWEKVVDFHGHACCILAVGYRAAGLALQKLAPLSGDERLAAVVETLDCSSEFFKNYTGHGSQIVLGY